MKPHMHFTINSEARKIESKEEKLKEHKKYNEVYYKQDYQKIYKKKKWNMRKHKTSKKHYDEPKVERKK